MYVSVNVAAAAVGFQLFECEKGLTYRHCDRVCVGNFPIAKLKCKLK